LHLAIFLRFLADIQNPSGANAGHHQQKLVRWKQFLNIYERAAARHRAAGRPPAMNAVQQPVVPPLAPDDDVADGIFNMLFD
jgi:hypothetical protein